MQGERPPLLEAENFGTCMGERPPLLVSGNLGTYRRRGLLS
jgi:hypothetical protein